MRKFLFLSIIFFSVCLYAQTESPSLPLRAPLEQTSNFAEYRKNHFHGGLDLRVINKADRSVFSIWEGYVSRVRFNAASYGRAVYVTHPNGYTSVYGHLNSFIPEIDSVVKTWQYEHKQFNVDIELKEGQIPLKKGQKIGVAGNSGYSFGAHLHFEIRKNNGETPVNPALFYDLRDNTPPMFKKLYIYTPCKEMDYPYSSKSFATSRSGSNYIVNGTVLIPDSSYLGFDVQDYQSGGWSRLLPYSIQIFFDDSLIWHIEFNNFSYSESSACASVFDHKEGLNNRKQIVVSKKGSGNRLSMYKKADGNGYLVIKDNQIHKIKVKATDTELNSSTLFFKIKRSTQKQKECECINVVGPGYFHEFVTDNIILKLDTFSFYDKYCLEQAFMQEYYKQNFIHWKIGNPYLALAKPIRVEFPGITEWPEQYVFAQIINGNIRNAWMPQKDKNGIYYYMLNRLGEFSLIKDSIAPVIKKTNVRNGQNYQYSKTMTFVVADNSTEIPKFNAWINEEWILMTYDYKNDLFSIELTRAEHSAMKNLKVEFIDLAGNKSELYFDFLRP